MSEGPSDESYEIRPLSMAETLDAGFQLMKNHLVPLSALSFVGQIPTIFIFSLFGWMLDPFAFQKGELPDLGATFLVGIGLWLLGMMIVLPIAIGSITAAVSDVYLGAKLSLQACLDRGVARMFPLMITYVVFTLILTVALVILIGAVVFVGVGLAAVLQGGAVGVALLVVAALVAIPLIFALGGLLTLIPGILAAVVVLEELSLFEAIARTLGLVSSALSRLCGIGVVLYLFVGIVPTGVQFLVGSIPVAGAIVWGIATAVCQAYLYATTVIAYFDLRCRLESFDLEHLAQLVEGRAPVPGPIR